MSHHTSQNVVPSLGSQIRTAVESPRFQPQNSFESILNIYAPKSEPSHELPSSIYIYKASGVAILESCAGSASLYIRAGWNLAVEEHKAKLDLARTREALSGLRKRLSAVSTGMGCLDLMMRTFQEIQDSRDRDWTSELTSFLTSKKREWKSDVEKTLETEPDLETRMQVEIARLEQLHRDIQLYEADPGSYLRQQQEEEFKRKLRALLADYDNLSQKYCQAPSPDYSQPPSPVPSDSSECDATF